MFLCFNLKALCVNMVFFNQWSYKFFEVGFLGRFRDGDVALVEKGKQFFAFYILFKEIDHVIEQQPGWLVADYLCFPKHEIYAETLVFYSREVTCFSFISSEMEKYSCRFCREVYSSLCRP